MSTHPGIDKFRVVITRLANGVPTKPPLRLAVEYHRIKGTPVFIRAWDEKGRARSVNELDQVQLLEAYHKHRWDLA